MSVSRKRTRPEGRRYTQALPKFRRTRSFAPSRTRVTPVLAGRTRVGGFYGRYAGVGGRELKFFDTTIGFAIDSTGEVPITGQLALIPQGVTESTRVGRKCVIKSITIRGDFTAQPSTATLNSQTCHMMLVMDKQTNGAAAAATDVMTGTNFSTALRNLSNSERFVIIKRWDIVLQPLAGVSAAYNESRRWINWTKSCNIPMEYSSTTGAIGEIRSNNIFLLAGAQGSDDIAAFNGVCRLRFSDN